MPGDDESDVAEVRSVESSADELVFENAGYCPCCRSQTTFRAVRPWLRDYYLCRSCGSIPRQRHLQAVLDDQFVGWEQLIIHESSPSSDFIRRHAADYSFSYYLPDVPVGRESADGIRSENLERLQFPAGSFDLFVTQDVLEHVFDPARAIAEIQRVLRPGGAHVFTTPKHPSLASTRQRARVEADGTTTHLLEAEYHGNPIGDGRSLVTFDYGLDFEGLLSIWAKSSVEVFHTLDRSRGLDAEFNEVFVIRKPPAPALHPMVQKRIAQATALRDNDIGRLNAEIHALKTSTSWRATRPLRATTDAFRSLRTRLPSAWRRSRHRR